jgi:hypothetical protein
MTRTYKLCEDAPNSPHIHSFAIVHFAVEKQLRGTVALTRLREAICTACSLHHSAQTKIRYLQLPIPHEHYVARLQISVNNTCRQSHTLRMSISFKMKLPLACSHMY